MGTGLTASLNLPARDDAPCDGCIRGTCRGGPAFSPRMHGWRERLADQRVTWEVAVPRGSSSKRERQYEHIRDSEQQRGASPARAKEIAARTVNKARARTGEARTASRSSVNDISSSRRGGLRSHKGAAGPTKAQLYNEARQRGIKGRSSMTKAQLARALGR